MRKEKNKYLEMKDKKSQIWPSVFYKKGKTEDENTKIKTP